MQREGEVTAVSREGGFALIARGEIIRTAAQALASALCRLDPNEHPAVTVDLQEATGIDPLVITALVQAWERRQCRAGCVCLLVSPGPVEECLVRSGLTSALLLVHAVDAMDLPPADEPGPAKPEPAPGSDDVPPRLPRRRGPSWH